MARPGTATRNPYEGIDHHLYRDNKIAAMLRASPPDKKTALSIFTEALRAGHRETARLVYPLARRIEEGARKNAQYIVLACSAGWYDLATELYNDMDDVDVTGLISDLLRRCTPERYATNARWLVERMPYWIEPSSHSRILNEAELPLPLLRHFLRYVSVGQMVHNPGWLRRTLPELYLHPLPMEMAGTLCSVTVQETRRRNRQIGAAVAAALPTDLARYVLAGTWCQPLAVSRSITVEDSGLFD